MKKINVYLALLAVVAVMIGVFTVAPTAEAVKIFDACSGVSSSQVCASRNDSATPLIKRIVNTLLFILGAVAVIMIIISGIRYTTSAGNASQVTAAKNTLLYSVVGLLVAIFAYAIVGFVINAV